MVSIVERIGLRSSEIVNIKTISLYASQPTSQAKSAGEHPYVLLRRHIKHTRGSFPDT